MTEYAERYIDFVVDEEGALNAFKAWLKDGAFVHNDAHEAPPLIEKGCIEYINIDCKSLTEWTAEIGTLNAREWDRDLENYRREYERYERRRKSGDHHGSSPYRPDKINYYSWSRIGDKLPQSFNLIVKMFSKTSTGDSEAALRACSSMIPLFEANRTEFTSIDGDSTFNTSQLKNEAISYAEKSFEKYIENHLKKNFDKNRGYSSKTAILIDSAKKTFAPVYFINYSVNEKSYTAVADGINLSVIGGNKPRDVKRIAKVSVISGGVISVIAAIGVVLYHFFGGTGGNVDAVKVPIGAKASANSDVTDSASVPDSASTEVASSPEGEAQNRPTLPTVVGLPHDSAPESVPNLSGISQHLETNEYTKNALCEITDAGKQYKSLCKFTPRGHGSFFISPADGQSAIVNQMISATISVTGGGMATGTGNVAGSLIDLGNFSRSVDRRACWVAQSRPLTICVR